MVVGMSAEPKPTQLTDLRDRLVRNNVLMRYDYAWKECEFSQCESRLVGVACRLLYLFGVWRMRCQEHQTRVVSATDPSPPAQGQQPQSHNIDAKAMTVYIESNGYEEFDKQLRRACELMDCTPLDQAAMNQASAPPWPQVAFVYVAPPHEERVTNQFDALQRVLERVKSTQNPSGSASQPVELVVCCLLGDTDFLKPPIDAEQERVRGLSGFALSQTLQRVKEESELHAITHFAVEFTPPITRHSSSWDAHDSTNQLHGLMTRFGASTRNLASHSEKWEIFAPKDSFLTQHEQLVTASEEEETFWVELAQEKECHHCHRLDTALFRCSRCQQVLYCSRECQKAAWKLHKPFCIPPVPVQAQAHA